MEKQIFGKLPQISNEQPDQNGVLQHLSNAFQIKIRLGYVQSVFIVRDLIIKLIKS